MVTHPMYGIEYSAIKLIRVVMSATSSFISAVNNFPEINPRDSLVERQM